MRFHDALWLFSVFENVADVPHVAHPTTAAGALISMCMDYYASKTSFAIYEIVLHLREHLLSWEKYVALMLFRCLSV
jgi:hypothetical protein